MHTAKKVSVHQAFVVIHAGAAALTLLPTGLVSKACRLGYKAVCSFAPISTAMLLALLAMHAVLLRREATPR